jgi:hypothetical protein
MATTYSWIGDVLETPHLAEDALDSSRFERFRMMFDRSHLLNRANVMCNSLNSQAGEVVIYPETFTDTHPVIGRYIIEDDDADITMELAILPEGPGVVFSSKKKHALVNRIQRYCGLHPTEKNSVICKLLIDPAMVRDAEIQEWFNYLLSGLHHSFKPQPAEPILTQSWLAATSPAFGTIKH